MSQHLSPLQVLGFSLFLRERPNGIRYTELGDYKQTTVGSMWEHAWIEYLPGRDLVRISRAGLDRWEQEQKYLTDLTMKRAHPSDNLSMRIDVTAADRKQRKVHDIGRAKKNQRKPTHSAHSGGLSRSARSGA